MRIVRTTQTHDCTLRNALEYSNKVDSPLSEQEQLNANDDAPKESEDISDLSNLAKKRSRRSLDVVTLSVGDWIAFNHPVSFRSVIYMSVCVYGDVS